MGRRSFKRVLRKTNLQPKTLSVFFLFMGVVLGVSFFTVYRVNIDLVKKATRREGGQQRKPCVD